MIPTKLYEKEDNFSEISVDLNLVTFLNVVQKYVHKCKRDMLSLSLETNSPFSNENQGHSNHCYAVQKDISSEPRFQRFQCKKYYGQKIIPAKDILSRVEVGHVGILMPNVTERPEM